VHNHVGVRYEFNDIQIVLCKIVFTKPNLLTKNKPTTAQDNNTLFNY